VLLAGDSNMMRCLLLTLGVVLAVAGSVAIGQPTGPEPGLHLVYAVTQMAGSPPLTTIYLQEASSGAARAVYSDSPDGDRILTRIAGSDLVGAAQANSRGIYCAMGPVSAPDAAACADALCRLDISAGMYRPATLEPLFSVPLCFSEESPYGLWNRAPLVAASPDGRRFAMLAVRVGEERLPNAAIRVLAATGEEEWQIPLEGAGLYVVGLGWSPDCRTLAYALMPQGDEHTLDPAVFPKAGVYVADVGERTTRFLYHCFSDAVTWGPRPDRITVAARSGGIDGYLRVARILSLPDGKKIEEFSLQGRVAAISYSDDGKWLAVQTRNEERQQIWLYPSAEGWGRLFHEVPEEEGRLALLGWARLPVGEEGREPVATAAGETVGDHR
jgi:hypothetical protein